MFQNALGFLHLQVPENKCLLYISGKKELPDSKMIVEKFLLRRKFIPDPQGTNIMFTFFAQHFTHQYFKTDTQKGPGFTKGLGHGVGLVR